jgi:hypothetical protein
MADSSASGGQDGGAPAAQPPDDLGWAHTVTTGPMPGGGAGGAGPSPASWTGQAGTGPAAPLAWGAGGPVSAPGAGYVVRHGPGVPVGLAAGPGVPTAEQVWQAGQPAAAPRWRRTLLVVSTAVSIALLAASGVVIFLRLHHGSFGVTGVAITGQARNGCTVDVTGRISTTGAAGTVSYQWIFSSQQAPPQPASQSAAAGQSAVYVTAAIQGQGHGSVTQQVTLQVLGPGRGTASIPVTVSC